ncbi:MAG TPA: hypothetical protein VM848_13395 [Acidimicrobiia bacterium]|nr:hypothetical protein [Acidimicrobiia bacterium]
MPLQIPVMLAPVGALALYHADDAKASGLGAARAGTSIFCGILGERPLASPDSQRRDAGDGCDSGN